MVLRQRHRLRQLKALCSIYEHALNALPDAIQIVNVRKNAVVFQNRSHRRRSRSDKRKSSLLCDQNLSKSHFHPKRKIRHLSHGYKLFMDELHVHNELVRVFESLPQTIWLAAPNGAILYHNQRWLEYSGGHIALGFEDWKHVIHPDDREMVISAWLRSVKTCQDFEVEYRLRSADGSYRWFLCRCTPSCK